MFFRWLYGLATRIDGGIAMYPSIDVLNVVVSYGWKIVFNATILGKRILERFSVCVPRYSFFEFCLKRWRHFPVIR